jgi:cytochrome c oxidase subunit IV
MTDTHSETSESSAAHGDAHHGEGHGHIAPMPLLIGVLGALIVLTVLTVAVTAVDLGSQGNFVVAMIVATIKAILVMGFFMHLIWDSKFNVIAFTSSFLFVMLFLGMAVLDRSEYRSSIQSFENDAAAAAKK